MNAPQRDWTVANQRDLAAALEAVRLELERARDGTPDEAGAIRGADEMCPPTLRFLSESLGLSSFERSVLLLAAGRELSGSFAATLARLNGGRSWPTFSLALALLPDAHWSALAPDGPLRSWRLIELTGEGGLPERELRIDEQVLHWLTGLDGEDERLAPLLMRLPEAGQLAPSHAALALKSAQHVRAHARSIVEISGADPDTRRAFAHALASALGLEVAWLPSAHIPTSTQDRAELALRLQRRARLRGRTVLMDAEGPDAELLLLRLAHPRSPVIMSRADSAEHPIAGTWQVRLEAPTREEMKGLWVSALEGHRALGENEIDRVASDFSLSPAALASVAEAARLTTDEDPQGAPDLWDAARERARRDPGELARRVEPRARWDDLVLPERQKSLLRDIAAQVQNRWRVHDHWGFAQKSSRGLGLCALFIGQSGTGKTMAAEVLAGTLGLDLYQIDLSSVVSKYIGETEKNLRRLFDAAEGGGAVLFFDEADALFGKRSEVKDSHDRYANIEVSYLLQRMEAYRGLAILATNMKGALDHAFLRRIRFVVEFPFPDAQRSRGDLAPRVSRRHAHERARLRAPGAASRAGRQHPLHRAERRFLRGGRKRAGADAPSAARGPGGVHET